jgi:NADH:ubiquinone oxidoreductase subunit 5 (subunit L)/multisubunit Na+/H+ antiporter MnhA subunit
MYVPLLVLSAFAIAVAWRPADALNAGLLFGLAILALVTRGVFGKSEDPSDVRFANRLNLVTAALVVILWLVAAIRQPDDVYEFGLIFGLAAIVAVAKAGLSFLVRGATPAKPLRVVTAVLMVGLFIVSVVIYQDNPNLAELLFSVAVLAFVAQSLFTIAGDSPALARARQVSFVAGCALLGLWLIATTWRYTVNVSLADLLENARPESARLDMAAAYLAAIWPDEHRSHVAEIRVPVTLMAFGVAVGGFFLATLFYGWRTLSADEVRRQFAPIHRLLWNKWYFDELYHLVFFKPTHVIARWASWIDRRILDGAIDATAWSVGWFARQWDYLADRKVVDGLVNGLASLTYATGLAARKPQRGHLREYVVYIVVGTVALFVVVLFFRERLFAG